MNALATLYAFIAALYVYVFLYRPRMDMFYNELTPIVPASPPARLVPQPQPYTGPEPTSQQTLMTYIVSQPHADYPPPMMTPQTVPPSVMPPIIAPMLSMFKDSEREEPFMQEYMVI